MCSNMNRIKYKSWDCLQSFECPSKADQKYRLITIEDRLRCFVRHNQHQKSTFKSSRVAIKSSNILHQIDPRLMRLSIFEFRTAICVNIWLVYGQKAKTVQIYHGHSMEKTRGSETLFSSWISDGACISAIQDCNLCVLTSNAPKKTCGLWLTFFATWPRRASMCEPY